MSVLVFIMALGSDSNLHFTFCKMGMRRSVLGLPGGLPHSLTVWTCIKASFALGTVPGPGTKQWTQEMPLCAYPCGVGVQQGDEHSLYTPGQAHTHAHVHVHTRACACPV